MPDAEWIVITKSGLLDETKAGQGNFTISAEVGGVEGIITVRDSAKHSTLDLRLVTLDDEVF